MLSVYKLKSAFSDFLRPLTNWLAAQGVTANQVTLGAMLGSVLLALGLYLDGLYLQSSNLLWLLVPIWMFIRMAMNNIDGMLAREHDMATPLGAILNEIGDVISDSALFLMFAILPGMHSPLLVLLTLLAIMSEMIGVIAVQVGASRRYDGPSGKSDRAVFFGTLATIYAVGIPLDTWTAWFLVIINILLVITIFNRGRGALRELQRAQSG